MMPYKFGPCLILFQFMSQVWEEQENRLLHLKEKEWVLGPVIPDISVKRHKVDFFL